MQKSSNSKKNVGTARILMISGPNRSCRRQLEFEKFSNETNEKFSKNSLKIQLHFEKFLLRFARFCSGAACLHFLLDGY